MKSTSVLEKWSYGIALALFLTSIFIPFLVVNSISFILESFDYYMSFSISFIDHILLSAIPLFALLLNKKRTKLNLTGLFIDNLVLMLSIIIIATISFYFLTLHSKSGSPLIPDNVLIEPFSFYWTIVIVIGLVLPFLVIMQSGGRKD